jgi:hypothetical protein
MMQPWLQLALALGLALAAWITGMDTTGSSAVSSTLWAAAAITGAHLLFRLLTGTR